MLNQHFHSISRHSSPVRPVPGCLDSLDFRQRMYQASLAMRISVSFSRLLLNWVATYRHSKRGVIPNTSSVTYIWLNEDTVRLKERPAFVSVFVPAVKEVGRDRGMKSRGYTDRPNPPSLSAHCRLTRDHIDGMISCEWAEDLHNPAQLCVVVVQQGMAFTVRVKLHIPQVENASNGPKQAHLLQQVVLPSLHQLVEDVEVSLPVILMHHPRLLQQEDKILDPNPVPGGQGALHVQLTLCNKLYQPLGSQDNGMVMLSSLSREWYHISQEMIEGGITSMMSGIIENAGHHPSPQDYRLLTTDPSQLREEDLPGDLQSLSWLTSVDVPRLQQMADSRGLSNGPPQGSLLEQQTAQLSNMTAMTAGQGSMLHLQSNMQHSPLGISIGSMSPFSMNGMPSPGYQCPTSVYQSAPQQCSTGGLYSNVSFNNQSLFTQPRLAPQDQELQPKSFPKPIYSYSCLIAMALKNSKTGSLPVSEIYSFMKEHFPYFKIAPDGWKNSVRHNLSLNKCFEKVENKTSSSSRKGCLWALNPAKIDKMEEEMQKWKRKDLPAIRRSMANPESDKPTVICKLCAFLKDVLPPLNNICRILEMPHRPENCRRKALEAGMTRLPSCPSGLPLSVPSQMQPQPIVTLSLPCLPMHQHHQLQAQLHAQARLAPMSPAPAQTPPLHTVPDLCHSPLTQHSNKQHEDFYIVHEMKDDSFNLDALGTFSNSPLRLSDCDLGTAHLTPMSNGANLPLSDVQVTGLYTAYTTQDHLASQYMGAQANNKPIALL
ncbi:hypothetical protein F7725_012637 [Dissostichus mawsoni]|uniref:Fork-head domain-containing protein n=2 Tax=Gnathostomata TaxID=7776 RepID=A0A7J5YN76_DISMA|nr:hypothetical protein F7725_012637 [Dissostichus mawsoni]